MPFESLRTRVALWNLRIGTSPHPLLQVWRSGPSPLEGSRQTIRADGLMPALARLCSPAEKPLSLGREVLNCRDQPEAAGVGMDMPGINTL